MKPSAESTSGARQGLYELYGDAAREASSDPYLSFFVAQGNEASACDAAAAVEHSRVAAVPWVDAEDPINRSRLEFYIDPKVELQLRFSGEPGYICQHPTPTSDVASCVCKLSGVANSAEWNMLGRLAMISPSKFSALLELQLSMSRRCEGGGLLDLELALLTVLALLFLVLCLEAALALRAARQMTEVATEATAWGEEAVAMDPPLKIFSAGFGWILGFVASVMTLQTVVLFLVKKSAVPEIAIWLLIYFPCFLAAGGAYRLTNLLCKKQLMHAFLPQGICLTGSRSTLLDSVLLLSLAIYASGVVLSVGSMSLKASAVVFLALLSPAWTLVKALKNAQETEARMDQLILVSRVEKLTAKAPRMVPWQRLVSASRAGEEDLDGPEAVPQVDFNLFRDLLWHRRRMSQLGSGSWSLLVLPVLALTVFGFVGISSIQAMSYACSRGELADLQLASSLLSIDFSPWQQKYAVQMDVSFKQATLVALADAPSTRWITFTQPSAAAGAAEAVEDDKGAVIAEIRLARQRIPRVATVRSQGLRPSLPATEQFIRFSPLKTLPARLSLSGLGFQRVLAWSTLPRSTISLPPGLMDFNLSITLHDFFLGLPVAASSRVDRKLWTVFEPLAEANEASCTKSCEENLDCLTSFPGYHGCFEAYNNHSHHEAWRAASGGMALAANRTLRGQLAGCRLLTSNIESSVASCTSAPIPAKNHIIDFGVVRPDWLGNTARLEFSLILEVGDQEFLSEVVNLDFRQGLPVPLNVVTLLRHDNSGVSGGSRGAVEGTTATVRVKEYDPHEVTSALRLLAMPLLPDRAFEIQWLNAAAATQEELVDFGRTEQCVNSMLVRKRYEVCGANGPLKDKPVAVQVAAWTGQVLDSLDFYVVPKVTGPSWPASQRWSVTLQFDGVDSPAAWAAKKYGCKVIDMDEGKGEVANALASSSDALCTLMEQHCGERLCDLLKRSLGTGQSRTYLEANLRLRHGAMLSSEGIVKALSCALSSSACEVSSFWEYQGADGSLKLEGAGATLSVDAFMRAIAALGPVKGPEFLWNQSFSATHVAQSLHSQLATALWNVAPTPELVKALAAKSLRLPQIILQTMIQLKAGESVEAEASSLQVSFTNVRTLSRPLEDARQVRTAALAMRLAPNVTKLSLSCKACPMIAKEALMTDWQHLFPYLQQLHWLHLDSFSMTRPGLSQAFAEALRGSNLESFTLLDCTLGPTAAPLAVALGHIRSLTELDLSQISADWPLGTAVANLTGLRKLTYASGNPAVARDLLQQLGQRPPKHLEVLWVQGDGIGSESAESLSKLLPALPRLRELSLAENRLEDSFAVPLIEGLRHTDCVILDLRNNNFTEKTKRWIFAAAGSRRKYMASDEDGRVTKVGQSKTAEMATLRKPLAWRQMERRAKEV